MPPSSPTNRKSSNPSPTRNQLVERCSTLRGCEPCKRRKRICNGQKPCTHCIDASQECVYSVISDHPRSVFTTNSARRLSSGSACETCRRRKTKCDGLSPCGFCANNGIECINNSERRKRSLVASSLSTSTTNTSNSGDNEAIDRIEDRLRRIEKLMTAFSPSPLSQSNIPTRSTAFRKLSSPHLQKPASLPPRQQRHSIHNFSSSKDQDNKTPYITPPNSNGSTKKFADQNENSPSPPLSPRLLKQSLSTNMALLNLSLSPSSSSTSSSSYIQQSMSTPTSPPVNKTQSKEWKQSSPIPSLMDQLSKCTFVTTAMDYTTVHYPIYPITPPSTLPKSP